MMFFSLLTMSSDRIVKIGFMDKSQVVQTVQLFDQLSMVLWESHQGQLRDDKAFK